MRRTGAGVLAVMFLVATGPAALAQKNSPAVTRDADHDGVPDMRDRCPGTPVGFAVDSAGCPTGVVHVRALPAEAAATPRDSGSSYLVVLRYPKTRVGLGAAIGGYSGSILVPILQPSGLSIEPSVGFTRSTSETTGFGIVSNQTTTALLLEIALGIPVAQYEAARFYVAPRFGLALVWAKMDSGGSVTSSAPVDWTAGLGLGGEVFVTSRASVGGELGITYVRTDDDAGGGFTSRGSLLSMGGRLAVRWYFGSR